MASLYTGETVQSITLCYWELQDTVGECCCYEALWNAHTWKCVIQFAQTMMQRVVATSNLSIDLSRLQYVELLPRASPSKT